MSVIRISSDMATRIAYHGEKVYPEECCGAIIGTEQDDIRRILVVEELHNNQEANREMRFLITDDQYREVEKLAARNHLQVLGFYHSHPDHPAEPSRFDLGQALPWFTYMIQSVLGRRAGILTAWRLSEDRARFDQQTLIIEG